MDDNSENIPVDLGFAKPDLERLQRRGIGVGYGASFNGLAPLLTMLNSCAEGIAVVNIDNGFGGGYMAVQTNRKIEGKK
jgi:hypothetical protein